MPLIQFTIPGPPKAKGRPRAAVIRGHARVFTPADTAREESNVRWIAAEAMRIAATSPLDGPLSLWMSAYMPIPASWSRRKQQAAAEGAMHPTGRPDVDNLAKLVCDACNGIVWRDDAQIVVAVIRKSYAINPRVEIEVTPVTTSVPAQMLRAALVRPPAPSPVAA